MSYGCYDHDPFNASTESQDGWTPTSRVVQTSVGGTVTRESVPSGRALVSVPFRMSPDCQYTHTDLGQVDPRCAGCKHRAEVAS